jgi:hypothetical protein
MSCKMNNDRILPQIFNCSVRYISDVLSLNNCVFGDYLHLIYQSESEVMDTTDTHKSASYLHRYLEIDNLNIKSKTLWKTWWLHSIFYRYSWEAIDRNLSYKHAASNQPFCCICIITITYNCKSMDAFVLFQGMSFIPIVICKFNSRNRHDVK